MIKEYHQRLLATYIEVYNRTQAPRMPLVQRHPSMRGEVRILGHDFSCNKGTGSNVVELPKGLLIASSEKVALRAHIYIYIYTRQINVFCGQGAYLAKFSPVMRLTEPSSESSSALENYRATRF